MCFPIFLRLVLSALLLLLDNLLLTLSIVPNRPKSSAMIIRDYPSATKIKLMAFLKSYVQGSKILIHVCHDVCIIRPKSVYP